MIIQWEIGAIQPMWLYGGNVWNYVSGDGGAAPISGNIVYRHLLKVG